MNKQELLEAVRSLPVRCIDMLDEGFKAPEVITYYNKQFTEVAKAIASSRCPCKVYLLKHLAVMKVEFTRQHFREKEYLRNAINRSGCLLPVEFGFKRK